MTTQYAALPPDITDPASPRIRWTTLERAQENCGHLAAKHVIEDIALYARCSTVKGYTYTPMGNQDQLPRSIKNQYGEKR